jgi:MoaA/NifB/PqqE/SkfB family radical SAM enzyme
MSISLSTKLSIAKRIAGKPGTPRFASLFVTRKCNLACPYCRSIKQDFKDIDTEAWKRVTGRLHEFGCRMFTLTGGEPMVRKDIFEIIRHIAVTQKDVCWMISNFGLVNREVIDRLQDSGLQFLTCSIDSFGGKGVKSHIEVLDLLEYAKSRGIISSTLTVITRHNIKEVPVILDEVIRRGLIFDMGLFQNIGGLFSPHSQDLKPVDMDELEKLRQLLRNRKLFKGRVSPSWGYLNANLKMYVENSWKCSVDRDRFLVVNNDGTLMACQEYGTGIDTLSIKSLEDPVWRKARKDCVEQCMGCFYGCYYQKENVGIVDILLDAWAMLRV